MDLRCSTGFSHSSRGPILLTSANIQAAFKATRIAPFNPSVILNKLTIDDSSDELDCEDCGDKLLTELPEVRRFRRQNIQLPPIKIRLVNCDGGH